MHKPMKTGGAEIGILNIDFNECGCFLCFPHDGFGKIIIVNISLDQAAIQLSHRVYCHQDGDYVDMELSENYQKYINDLRENFNNLLLTQPNFQTSRKEKYTVYKRYIMQCPKITMLSGDGALVIDFYKSIMMFLECKRLVGDAVKLFGDGLCG